MKKWLNNVNKRLYRSIKKKTYNEKDVNGSKRRYRVMYDGEFHNYLSALDKAMVRSKKKTKENLSFYELFGLRFEKFIYWFTKRLGLLLTFKDRRHVRKLKIQALLDDLNEMQRKHPMTRYSIRKVKDELIKKYEEGLDGLK